MGVHQPIPTNDVLTDAAERIHRSMRQGTADAPAAVASLVAEALEQASGERIRDQAQLARQMVLWHRAFSPERARSLTVAALADRAGALRRSVLHRRLERGAGE